MLAFFCAMSGVVLVAAWYICFRELNRRRARHILRWLEQALASEGRISGVEWISPSHFRARLCLSGGGFRQPSVETRLAPREMPVRWALWRLRGRRETVRFEANLSCPPRFGLEIGHTHWTGLSRRWMRYGPDWPSERLAPLYISTLPEWEPEIAGHMSAVVAATEFDFLDVSYRTRPPHFSATLPLEDTLRRPGSSFTIFDSLRALAEGSSTSRM